MEFCFRSVTGFLILLLFPNFVLAQGPASLETMTLEQKVGQLFIIGFPQQRVDAQLETFIKKYKISSFILFKRNILNLAQVAQMNARLQKVAMVSFPATPLIAVDQEGGQVARVPTRPPIPTAMSVGQTDDPKLAHALGQETAKIIRILGFNMNLAPVLDVASPESESFIGLRSFGSDAVRVGQIGAAVSQGLLDEAVIPTAKHFPGVGSVTEDPHKKRVEYNASSEEIFSKDIRPFEDFAKLGPHTAMMMSHFSYPTLDATKLPATLSPHIIKDILRGQLAYQGLVITDDIQMKGLSQVSSPYEAALTALKAGADLIMMTWSFSEQAKAIERVRKAVASGELSVAELNEKVSRILEVKEYLRTSTPKLTGVDNPKIMALSTKRLREIESRILDFNIRVALRRNLVDGRTPATATTTTDAKPEPLCVYSPTKDFIGSFRQAGSDFSSVEITPATRPQKLIDHLKNKHCRFGVFVVHGPKTAALLERLPPDFAKKLLVVNLSAPSLIPEVDKYLNVVNLYFAHPDAGKKISENLRALARRSPLKNGFARAEF
jgi:beta-N-acetylhexosaminidase